MSAAICDLITESLDMVLQMHKTIKHYNKINILECISIRLTY